MSILSDIQTVFNPNGGATDFIILPYPAIGTGGNDTQINIYGVFELNTQQQNAVAIKPLEQSNFTVDSVQIKPYVINIRGVLLPDNQNQVTDYNQITDYINRQLATIRNYLNGTQLFTLFNTFSCGVYQPLKLFGLNTQVNVDLTIPEVTLSFMQVQTTSAVSYSTTQVTNQNVAQPTNQPNIQTQS